MTVETASTERVRPIRSGKVRDVYAAGEHLMIVASDRISAFDVVLPTAIPGKGTILTQLSRFWFERLDAIVPNHMTSIRPSSLGLRLDVADLDERAVVVRSAERIPIECVVRGYLAGSAWAAYQASHVVFGHQLPPGLEQSARLPSPLFTPAIKNDVGHDETIGRERLAAEISPKLAADLEWRSLALYAAAADHAAARGLVLADTKFEFGWVDGTLTLIDEALTPDSSRFWLAASYAPGIDPPSLDKQFVRDWLVASGWNKTPPGRELPAAVVEGTRARYADAFQRLTGTDIAAWLAARGRQG